MADISFSERAWEEFQYWLGQDKKTVKRITVLLKDISRNPFEGIGKPEPLAGEKGKWSRRINGADRLVYSVDDRGVKKFTAGQQPAVDLFHFVLYCNRQ